MKQGEASAILDNDIVVIPVDVHQVTSFEDRMPVNKTQPLYQYPFRDGNLFYEIVITINLLF